MHHAEAMDEKNSTHTTKINSSGPSSAKKHEDASSLGNLPVNDRLITAREVSTLLSISRVTLWRMGQSGALTPVFIGGCKRYRLSDVTAIISGEKEVA